MKKLALLLLIAAFVGTAAVLVPFFREHLGKTSAPADDAAAKPEQKDKTPETGKEKAGAKDDGTAKADDAAKAGAKDDDTAKAGAKEGSEKKDAAVIKCDTETQERVGLEVQPLEAVKQRPQLIAYGRAIDPTALAVLDGDLVGAEAALQASETAATRANTLFTAGENVARKVVESAASQFRADESHVQALRRRLALEWGASIAAMDDKARGAILDDLIKEKAALVRVDVPGGESVEKDPIGAKIAVLGREAQPIAAAAVAPAASIDPKAQAQGFLLQIDDPPFPVRPGVAVTAYLELPGEETEGVIVPRSAIVRYAGEAWAYVKSAEEEFERRRLPPGQVTEQGWFVSDGFKAGDKVVTTGAQALLASETASQSGGGDD